MNALHPIPNSRRNGLDRPWGYAQIGAWMAYAVSIVQYIIFVTPLLDPCITSPIVSMLFFTSNLFVLFYGSYTILVNPIDIHLHQYRTSNEMQQQQQQKENNHHHNGGKKIRKPIVLRNPLYQPPITLMMPNEASTAKKISLSDRLYYRTNTKQLQLYNSSHCQNTAANHHQHNHSLHGPSQPHSPLLLPLPNEPMKQCWICDASVAEHSMHCKFCNKCVYGFDHHCIWLNTCIGRANYEYFFRTLQSLFIMEIIHMLSHLILIITFFQDNAKLNTRISGIYPNMSSYAPLALWFFFLVFNCTAIMLLGQLYVFHTMLQIRNLTTYEHIVQDYRNQRDMTRRLNDMEAERAESIIRAQSQRDTTKVIQLKVGKFCREHGMPYFDVMTLPPEPEEPDPEAGFANIFGKSAAPDSVVSGDNHDDSHHNYQDDNINGNSNTIVNDNENDEVEITDYNNQDNDNHNNDPHGQTDREGDSNQKSTLYDTDISLRSNTSRSNHTRQSKNEFHDIMYDGDTQQPPNYVELTMSGQNDYYNETDETVAINDGGDHDEVGDHSNIASGLDTTTSQYYDDDDEGDGQEDDEEAVDGIFIDDPDDMSHKSGCSGRSYRSGRSGRSGRSSKSGRTGSKLTERDLTSF